MLRVGKIVFGRVDMDAGEFTYGNRIVLGEIFRSKCESTDQVAQNAHYVEQLRAAHKEIYGYSLRWLTKRRRKRRIEEIVKGFADWVKLEGIELHREPTPEELSAGVKAYSEKVGDKATVLALADQFKTDPDTIKSWRYAKVFECLVADFQKSQFEERLFKVQSKKGNGKYR